MNLLLTTLETIHAETGDGQKPSSSNTGDEFSRLRKHVATSVREVRDLLAARDDMANKGSTGAVAARTSHRIRQLLKQARDDAHRLEGLQRKEAAKTRGKEKAIEQSENHQEIIQLIFKDIEECELQEKKRYTGKNSEARVDLFAVGGRGIALGPAAMTGRRGDGGPSTSASTEHREIGADTQEGLQLLAEKNAVIDQQLEVVAEGVSELKTIALTMRDEVKVQSAMVEEITSKVDAASSHLNNINRRMKQTLMQTRSADRFILDFILLTVLLAIVGYIISLVTGDGR